MSMMVNPFALGPVDLSLGIVNPGAETGDLTGWDTVLGSPAAATGPDGAGTVPHSGSYYFYGGNVAQSVMAQTVPIQSGLHSGIDSNLVSLDVSYWDVQAGSDKGAVSIAWLDGSGNPIGCNVSSYLQRGNAPTWANDTLSTKVPAGARSVRVYHDAKRAGGGTSNDANIDDISGSFSVASPSTVELPIVNADASLGNLTGWTTISGSPTVLTSGNSGAILPRIGTHFFYPGTTATPSMYQMLTVPTAAHTSIDAGTATLARSAMICCVGSDQQRTAIEFYASNGTTLLGSNTPSYSNNTSTDWTKISTSGVAIPTGTRYIKMICQWNRLSGTSNDGYVHCFTATITL